MAPSEGRSCLVQTHGSSQSTFSSVSSSRGVNICSYTTNNWQNQIFWGRCGTAEATVVSLTLANWQVMISLPKEVVPAPRGVRWALLELRDLSYTKYEVPNGLGSWKSPRLLFFFIVFFIVFPLISSSVASSPESRDRHHWQGTSQGRPHDRRSWAHFITSKMFYRAQIPFPERT